MTLRVGIGNSGVAEKNMETVYPGTLSSGDTDANETASEAGYILIKLPQKAFTLFCKLLGGSQRHVLGEINQFMEGGLQNQTLKTEKQSLLFLQ